MGIITKIKLAFLLLVGLGVGAMAYSDAQLLQALNE